MPIDEKKLEYLKVWYAVFVTLVDDKEFPSDKLIKKLTQLREIIKRDVPELETEFDTLTFRKTFMKLV